MGNADGDPVPPPAAAETKLRKPQENCEEMEWNNHINEIFAGEAWTHHTKRAEIQRNLVNGMEIFSL